MSTISCGWNRLLRFWSGDRTLFSGNLFLWRLFVHRRVSAGARRFSINLHVLCSGIHVALSCHIVCNFLSTSFICLFSISKSWSWCRRRSLILLFYLILESISDRCGSWKFSPAFDSNCWLHRRFSYSWNRFCLIFLLSFCLFRRNNISLFLLDFIPRNRFLFIGRLSSWRWISTWSTTWLTINFHVFCSWIHVAFTCHVIRIFLYASSLLVYQIVLPWLRARSTWNNCLSFLLRRRYRLTGYLRFRSCFFFGFWLNFRFCFFFNFWSWGVRSWLGDWFFSFSILAGWRRSFINWSFDSISFHISCSCVHISFSCHFISTIFRVSWRFTLQWCSWRRLLIPIRYSLKSNILLWFRLIFANRLSSCSSSSRFRY